MKKDRINFRTREYVWQHPLINSKELERLHLEYANSLLTQDEYNAFFEDLRIILMKFDILNEKVAERLYK